MFGPLSRLWSNESGATVVEHAILACAVALVIVTFVGSGLSPRVMVRSAAYIADALLTGDDEDGSTVSDPAAASQ